MAHFNFIVLALFGLIVVSSSLVTIVNVESSNLIDGQYIIVFHSNITKEQKFNHIGSLLQRIADSNENYSRIITTYSVGEFQGFAAKLSSVFLVEQRRHTDLIHYIEQDQIVTAFQSCVTQNQAIWGLDRISEKAINLDGVFHYSGLAGQNVDAYIVDTGIYVEHNEFQGRARWGANYADAQNTDCNGHGTHVAGTVGGVTFGVAKKVSLIAVKVLNCEGSGTNTGVISGIEYVLAQYTKTKRPSVANMSLGGSKSTAINAAVTEAISGGVTFAVAAGNENTDACTKSPASTPTAVTVGATSIANKAGSEIDARSSFSNYGTCVDIFAPGSLIESAWIGSKTAVNTISGTSMATPHAAGVIALYLASNPSSTPNTVSSWIKTEATKNLIDLQCTASACTKSPNSLLYTPC